MTQSIFSVRVHDYSWHQAIPDVGGCDSCGRERSWLRRMPSPSRSWSCGTCSSYINKIIQQWSEIIRMKERGTSACRDACRPCRCAWCARWKGTSSGRASRGILLSCPEWWNKYAEAELGAQVDRSEEFYISWVEEHESDRRASSIDLEGISGENDSFEDNMMRVAFSKISSEHWCAFYLICEERIDSED